ncbi:uncharacterized protein LOC123306720 [Coccinella septempunctata]|uniref:uncharacterized protein LOC123306720 n=1 Tax=Coccinella septempunctata TaxID=41139 RepID=UPI001D05D92A|nr:uncharacterized protein LOC123306720 [Coccinella septempunctata]
MALINTKANAEIPADWMEIIESARCKPSPFKVIPVDNSITRDWIAFFEKSYLRKCPFPSRPIRELEIRKSHPRMIFHRDTFNGPWCSTVVTPAQRKTIRGPPLQPGEFVHPSRAYDGPLTLSKEKHKDLMALKKFCRPEAKEFFEALKQPD